MAQATLGEETSIDYYATSTGTPKVKTPGQEGVPEDFSDAYTTIGKLSLSGADNETKYHCQVKYTVSVEMKKADDTELQGTQDKDAIKDTDGKLYLKTTDGNGVTVEIKNDQAGQPDESGTNEISHDIKSLLSDGKTFWVTYDFVANGSDMNGSVEAAFKISNRNDDQNYLADKKITVKLTPETPKCEIVKADGE